MRKHIGVLLAMLALLIVPLPVSADTLTRYSNYTAGEDGSVELYSANWSAQTFNTSVSFELDKIRLRLGIEGAPGVLTVAIRAVNATNAPNGIDLSSGTIDDASLSTSVTWYDIDVDNIVLSANTVYAIVMYSTGTSATVNFHVGNDGSTAAYTSGSEWVSTDGGSNWAADTDDDYLFELWGLPVIEAYSAAVFDSYVVDNDWLAVLSYKNIYEPYYPASDPQSHFVVQLLSGSTVIAQRALPQWGYKPVGIYLSASAVTSLSWGSAYKVQVYGLDSPYPVASYTLTAADWKGSDLNILDSWCIATAHGMEDYYGTDFVILTSEKGEVLNEEGGVLFDVGIPGLAAQRGDSLFQVAASGIPYTEGTWTSAYGSGMHEWYVQLGPDISSTINATADIVGSDGKTLLLLLLLGGYGVVAILMIANGLNAGSFAVLSPFLMFGYALKVLPWGAFGAGIAILVVLAVRQLWWKST